MGAILPLTASSTVRAACSPLKSSSSSSSSGDTGTLSSEALCWINKTPSLPCSAAEPPNQATNA
eukprot:CAMPEP_0171114034 /NCGR_PEP_ID=MMETSP0766_2-20121228/84262_1 /TAXON_ID=439317 /ORGANISM="Gambierdiscus australes, Strain CAWD 149" /LENGTH=63 /DNA_ID=CAMNT_0011576293 /DNA_START=646 /DNA_END=833 /DNA_ORIENTATION=+